MAKPMTKAKRKEKKNIPVGDVVVNSTFNNTKITFTDKQGNVIAWSSAGKLGFKGSRKSTPYAAQMAAEDAAQIAQERAGMKEVNARLKGPGSGREPALRGIQAAGIEIKMIKDVTAIPHNGCRAKKKRRV